MAKLGFKYEVDVENTENQGGDFELMPEMYARLEVSAAELRPTQDEKGGTEAVLTIDVLEPEEFNGRKLWAYWIIDHPDGANNKRFFKFGKPNFDRLCRAIDLAEPEDTDDLLFKPFTAKVGISLGGDDGKGGKYKDKNEIKTFYYPDQPDKAPVIGVIEGGKKPAAANDNRASSSSSGTARSTNNGGAAATQKPTGSKPWASKAA